MHTAVKEMKRYCCPMTPTFPLEQCGIWPVVVASHNGTNKKQTFAFGRHRFWRHLKLPLALCLKSATAPFSPTAAPCVVNAHKKWAPPEFERKLKVAKWAGYWCEMGLRHYFAQNALRWSPSSVSFCLLRLKLAMTWWLESLKSKRVSREISLESTTPPNLLFYTLPD